MIRSMGMQGLTPILVGVDGLAAGEHFVLEGGRPIQVGRSSACDISLQRVPRYQILSETQRAQLPEFQAISRRHLTITITGTEAHLENHSQIGTWCDEIRFDGAQTVTLSTEGVTLRLGPREQFRLLLVDSDGLDQLMSQTRPMTLATTQLRSPEDQRETKPQPAL